MSPDETERLIFDVLDGSCEAGERERLMALLLEDAAAFEIYCRCCEMDSALHRIAKERAGLASAASIGGPHSWHRRRARASLLVTVAAVLMLGLLLRGERAPFW